MPRPDWDEYPCLEWTGTHHIKGYGQTAEGELAHRVAFMLYYGCLPELPFVVDHMCRNRLCIQPRHLQKTTLAENTRLGTTRRDTTKCNYGHSDWTVKGNGYRRCAECHRIRARGEWPPAPAVV